MNQLGKHSNKYSNSNLVIILFLRCFRGVYEDEVEDSEKLRSHAQKFMRIFAMLTDSLEDNTSDTKEINDFLLMLGAKHASFKGFDLVSFL